MIEEASVRQRVQKVFQMTTYWFSQGIVDPALPMQFMRAYVKAREAANGKPWGKALKYLPFHFEYYCKQRWPLLAADFQVWSELWEKVCPQAVIISSLEDGESMLPAKAARHQHIVTISIPHGAVQMKTTRFVASGHVLHHFPIQTTVYERMGIPSRRFIGCRDSICENEYETGPAKKTVHARNVACFSPHEPNKSRRPIFIKPSFTANCIKSPG